MKSDFCDQVETPIGKLNIYGTQTLITRITFSDDVEIPIINPNPFISECIRQIIAYFNDSKKSFDLPLYFQGSPFQRKVWNELRAIPYGQVCTYKQIAERIQQPTAARAVGAACNSNLFPIVIPCHRVIGTDGNLAGYAGGLWRKEWLIKMEANG